jgi:uncharacterized membrane protein YdbT with pleckstrin-like domain
MQRSLAIIGITAVVVLLGLVLWAGIGSLLTMEESSASQGGRYYVGAAVVVALVWLIGQFRKFSDRL